MAASNTVFGRELSEGGWYDPKSRTRQVPMEVLVLGLPRSGTSSMVEALKILGYNDVYHMSSALANPPDCDLWTRAIDYKYYGKGAPLTQAEWDGLLGHCMAVTDFPCAAFSEELISAYPDAKIILNTRDPDKWYKSVHDTIGAVMMSNRPYIVARIDRQFFGRWFGMANRMLEAAWGMPPTAEAWQKVQAKHYDEVRRLAPRDKFLEYQVGDGWESLCAFLEKPVPKVEFPRVNDSKSFVTDMQKMLSQRLVNRLTSVATIVVPLVIVGAGVYFAR